MAPYSHDCRGTGHRAHVWATCPGSLPGVETATCHSQLQLP